MRLPNIGVIGNGFVGGALSRGFSGYTDVKIFDYSNRRSDANTLLPTDLVVWVTTSNNHPSYHAIKSHCKAHGIGFYHFGQSGQKPLISFLQQLAV